MVDCACSARLWPSCRRIGVQSAARGSSSPRRGTLASMSSVRSDKSFHVVLTSPVSSIVAISSSHFLFWCSSSSVFSVLRRGRANFGSVIVSARKA